MAPLTILKPSGFMIGARAWRSSLWKSLDETFIAVWAFGWHCIGSRNLRLPLTVDGEKREDQAVSWLREVHTI